MCISFFIYRQIDPPAVLVSIFSRPETFDLHTGPRDTPHVTRPTSTGDKRPRRFGAFAEEDGAGATLRMEGNASS